MNPDKEQRYDAAISRLTRASRLLDAIALLTPETFADWLDHLDRLFDSIDDRLGRAEKRLDSAGVPVADGFPDDDVPKYLALYAVNPLTSPDGMDSWETLTRRLAAYRKPAAPKNTEASAKHLIGEQ